MQKNFTHLIQAVARARNYSAAIATLLFILLLQANTASAQASLPAPTQTNSTLCEFRVGSPNSVTFNSSYTASNGNNDRATTLHWEYSPTGANNSWSTVNPSGGTVNGVTTSSFSGNVANTTLTLTNVPVGYSGQYRAVYVRVVTNGNNTTTTTLARTAPATLTVNAFPTASINNAPSTLTFCSGGSVNLDAGTGSSSFTYQWQKQNQDGSYSNITNPNVNTTPYLLPASTSGNYRVIVGNNSCTSISNPVTVRVIQTPTASITANRSLTFCENQEVVLTAGATFADPTNAPAVGNLRYAWYRNSQLIPDETLPTYTARTSGNYSVIITNVDGTITCPSNQPSVTVNVIPLPVTNISAPNGTSACPATPNGTGGTVLLSANPVNNTYDPATAIYTWYKVDANGDNTLIPDANSRDYLASTTGRYRVQVTTPTTQCAKFSDNLITATILSPTTAINNYRPQVYFCEGGLTTANPILLTAAQGDNYTYTWYKKDIQNNTQLVVGDARTISVDQPGFYYVVIAIANSCTTESALTEVTQAPAITNNTITSPTTTICEGTAPGTITGIAPNGGVGTAFTYQWQISFDGENFTFIEDADARGINYSPGNLTQTTWFRRVATSLCSEPSNSVQITVNPAIQSNTITAPAVTTICAGISSPIIDGNVPVIGDGTVLYTFRWESSTTSATEDFSAATGTNNTQTYNPGSLAQTTWFRRVVLSGPCTNISNEVVKITVIPQPTANAGPDLSACPKPGQVAGEEITEFTLNNANGDFGTFEWSVVPGGTATAQILNPNQLRPTVNVIGFGTVILQLTTTSTTCGTQVSDQVTLTANPLPTATASSPEPTKCIAVGSNTTNFEVNGEITNTNDYAWIIVRTTGNATASIPTTLQSSVTVTGTGSVTLQLVAKTDFCQAGSAEVTLTVNPLPTATAAVAANEQTAKCVPLGTSSTTFQLNGQSNGNFVWTQVGSTGATASFESGAENTINPIVTVTGVGTVTLRLTTTSEVGCGEPATSDVILSLNQTPQVALADFPVELCTTTGIFPLTGGSFNGTTGATNAGTYSYNGPSGGVYSVTAANGAVNWFFDPSKAGAGQWSITYTVTANGQCANSATKTLSVKTSPVAPTFTGVTDGATIFSGEGNKTLSGTLVGATSGTFSGFGVSSTGTGSGTFNPCAAFSEAIAAAGTPDATTVNVAITYRVSNDNQCSNSITKNVTINKSVYQAVVTSSLKPFCRGDNVAHTVRLYREAVIIYPYLTNAAGEPIRLNGTLVGPQEFPVSNPAYPFPAGTTEAAKLLAWRFFNPVVVSGTEITSGLTYQWNKNQKEKGNGELGGQGADAQVFSNAGLSSLDYYSAYVTTNSSCPVLSNLVSSRTYTGQISGYAITLAANKNPICPSDAVTFTATLDETFPIAWTSINLRLNWILVTANGQRSVLRTNGYDGTPASLQYTTTALQNGDKISIEFTSDINGAYVGSKCFAEILPTNAITMIVAINQTLTGGSYCAGNTGTVRMNGSQVGISYQLLLNGSPVGNPVAGTGTGMNFNNLTAGSYTVQAIASGSTCLTYGPVALTENPLPEAPSGGNQTVCSNGTSTQTLTASATVPSGFSLIWYTSLSGTGTTASPTQVGVGSKTYYAALQNLTTSCIGPRTAITLTINAQPAAPIAANKTICSDGSASQTLTASATIPPGFNIIWYTSETDFGATSTPTQTGVGTANYWAAAQSQTTLCIGPRTKVTLTINPLPTANAGVNQENCTPGLTTTFDLAGTAAFGNFTWSVASNPNNLPVAIANPNQLNSKVTITGSGTITLKLTTISSFGCGTVSDEVDLVVNKVLNEEPEINEPNNLSYFQPATFTVESTNSNVNWTYRWFIIYSTGLPIEQKDQTGTTLTVPAEKMTTDFIGVQVVQVAPEGICYNTKFSSLAETSDLTILPVELLYLKATKQNNNVVELEWATAMEQNSEGFEVQVSQDAKNFRTLAFVASKAGGNTNQKQVYTFHDKENGKYGTRYYRLMQRDMNGDAEYFGPKAVKIGESVESLSAYPNPFTSEVNLEIQAEASGSLHVVVTNAAGAKILERTFAAEKGSNRETLRFSSSLPQGMYIITTRLNGKTSHFKLMKQ
ncbi:hypothetical protein AAE02nite_22170 [Adhaeribacter aerolatus]|uniref:Ig-like domain-containing protein n=1 Tax=Adhaeribacter aerolatus TaxID=670289 RepID=A0A512AXX5_9BACT|nr:T9SS type A sorting domain-containing protein [Adhaeribacter aerolatus]GEO04553.1 hypothetical protein AAE02nite_22170 [Adhaeribacter aerolatus]